MKTQITLVRYEVNVNLFEEDTPAIEIEYIYPINFIPIVPQVGEFYMDYTQEKTGKRYEVLMVTHALLRESDLPDLLIQAILISGRLDSSL